MADILARQRQIVGSAADWAGNDLVLGAGELALERQGDGSVRARVGDGSAPFSASPYLVGSTSAFTYRGETDPAAPPPAGAVPGDVWTASPGGTVGAGWGEPAAGEVVDEGDRLVMAADGTWTVVPGDVDLSAVVMEAELGAPDGAAMVGHKLPDAGAVPETLMAIFNRLTFSPEQFGAPADGIGDDTAGFEKALAELAARGGGYLWLSHGASYLVRPDKLAAAYVGDPSFGPTLKYAAKLRSNIEVVFNGATIKVADGVSTRAAPQNFAIFYAESRLVNVSFTGPGTFEMNGANNWFSPDPTNTGLPQGSRYLRYHQAAIFIEGPAGKIDDCDVVRLTFQNGAGVSTIIAGRYDTGVVGARWRIERAVRDDTIPIGLRWRIRHCTFLNMGLDTYDCSPLFLWCDDVDVSDNVFWNAKPYAPTLADLSGVNAAIETHGANTRVRDNRITNCNRMMFITENAGSQVANVIVSGNIGRNIKTVGIDVAFQGVAGVPHPRIIDVIANQIEMSPDTVNVDATTIPTAIQAVGLGAGPIAPIDGFRVMQNTMQRAPSANGQSSQAVSISLQGNGHKRPQVTRNEAVGFTRGLNLLTDPTTTCDVFASLQNRWLDPEGGTVPAVTKVGTFLRAQGGTIGLLQLADEIRDTRGTLGWAFGIAVTVTAATTVGRLEVQRGAQFDERFTLTTKINGAFTLTVARTVGVPVSGAFPDTGYATLTGASVVATPALPGVLATDELVVGYSGPVTNAGGFLALPFMSAANQVSLALRNVTGGTLYTTPGFTFYIVNYPGR